MARPGTQLLVLPLVVSLAGALIAVHWGAERSRLASLQAEPKEAAAPVTPPQQMVLLKPSDIALPTSSGDTLTFREIVVTGYTSCPRETDSTPFLTASMTTVRPGCLALSRDLLRTFTDDAPFDFGDWVVLPGVGIFIVEDTMNARWKNRGDIWFQNKRQARRWGRRRALIGRLPEPLERGTEQFALGPPLSARR